MCGASTPVQLLPNFRSTGELRMPSAVASRYRRRDSGRRDRQQRAGTTAAEGGDPYFSGRRPETVRANSGPGCGEWPEGPSAASDGQNLGRRREGSGRGPPKSGPDLKSPAQSEPPRAGVPSCCCEAAQK